MTGVPSGAKWQLLINLDKILTHFNHRYAYIYHGVRQNHPDSNSSNVAFFSFAESHTTLQMWSFLACAINYAGYPAAYFSAR